MSEAPLIVDARGHRCPVPTLKLRKAVEAAPPSSRLILLATDPMARIDAPHLMAEMGGRVVSVEDVEGGLRLTVETPAAHRS